MDIGYRTTVEFDISNIDDRKIKINTISEKKKSVLRKYRTSRFYVRYVRLYIDPTRLSSKKKNACFTSSLPFDR